MYANPIKEPLLAPNTLAAKDGAFLRAHIATALQPAGKAGPMPSAAATQLAARKDKNTLFTTGMQINPFDPKYAPRAGGYGMANYEIGRIGERNGVEVKEFDRKDRWKAWRVRAKKVKEKMMARASRANRKTKGKKSNKKVA